ncbi:DUF6213 family protein [Kitasatospora sp. NPDC058048]|uniref:DUF6213 family protein n=1 Tax=Kitasatospora sp. NPDC058048 TaxID=3346313 RepID=UPI0036D7DDD0
MLAEIEIPAKLGSVRSSVHRDQDGALVVPADLVTALLRGIAATWQVWAQRGVPGLDTVTATGLGAVLADLADQLDVECIATAGQDRPAGGRGGTQTSPAPPRERWGRSDVPVSLPGLTRC